MKNKIKTRCYQCKKCNKTTYFQSNTDYSTNCKTCGNEMQLLWEHDYKPNNGLKAIKRSNAKNNINTEFDMTKSVVKCPYCHSKNTKKISATSKVMNTVVWGFFGTKRHKQWHCNNCSSDF